MKHKIRIKFTKTGMMRFIGHLDVMRYFQKAMRRAEIDIVYSEGFSPHQKMSFAAPLGIGLTGTGEYFDIEVNSLKTSKEMEEALNKTMVEGFEVISCRLLPENAPNAMSSVCAADYTVSIHNDIIDISEEDFERKLNEFYSLPEIICEKETKKGSRTLDIKPLIYSLRSVGGKTVHMCLCTGSSNNLKPELVMAQFCKFADIEYTEEPILFDYQRNEIYTDIGEDGERTLAALEELGEIIEG